MATVELGSALANDLFRYGRAVSVLAVAALCGSLLGACGGGGGSALTTRTGGTATQPAGTVAPTQPTRTRTRPAVTTAPTTAPTTEPEPTPEPTTTEAVPTAPETTTRPNVTVTIQTQTTTGPEVVVPTTPTTTAVAAPPTSESAEETPWGWIALVLAVAAAVVVGLLVWRSRRSRAASWADRRADLTQRALIVLDDVLSQGSVVTGQVEALAAEARSVEQRAPDDAAKAEAARIRSRLDDLARVLESDRTLRLSSPPPSAEQVSYSTALIRQQVQELQGVLRSTDPRA